MITKKNILTVEIDTDTFDLIAPPLLRKLFEVDRIPSAAGGLELVSMVPFSAIVLRHPLQGMDTDDFLAAVKQAQSASRDARVALLTTAGDDASADEYLDRGVDLLVSLHDEPKEREQLLCALLGIQPRRDARVLVKLEVILTDLQSDRFVAQTKDVSSSGMFVITRKKHPVGSIARFEFNLAGDPAPVRGNAEVSRHSAPGDRNQGMGLRFLTFDEDGGPRLKRFIEAKKT
jgi:uncharacterized protein (TIGR02266 family)